jgi:hypothetical protein
MCDGGLTLPLASAGCGAGDRRALARDHRDGRPHPGTGARRRIRRNTRSAARPISAKTFFTTKDFRAYSKKSLRQEKSIRYHWVSMDDRFDQASHEHADASRFPFAKRGAAS